MSLSLLAALSAEKPTSGERLAEQFHCTRAAIAKRVAVLREMGVLIDAIPRVGYQLAYDYVWWDELRLAAEIALMPSITQWHLLPRVDSTNTWMRQHIAQAGINQVQLALTDFQFAGQGRRGREWMSLPGRQITASIGLVSAQGPTAWVGVAIAVGLSLASTLRQYGWPIELKWPNDLWLNGAKLGGILVEMDAMAEGPSRLIIGFGINEALLSVEREQLARPVSALQDKSIAYDRHELFVALCTNVLQALTEFSRSGLAPWQLLWPQYDVLAGRLVSFELQGEWREGVANGIDEQGALLIKAQNENLRCHSGEVSLRVLL
jgi:BirA family biotin operon repressor/biotin-[acetyl-CoA-carboxylase] ligase